MSYVSAHRIFVLPHRISVSAITVDDPRQVHHLRNVLRVRIGDPLICADGAGREYAGVVSRSTSRALSIRIEGQRTAPADALRLWLVQGLPKGDRLEWIVQKAVELGAARISPVVTRHTVVRVSASQSQAKQTRWQRIAQEAAQQCGQARLPVVDAPQPLEAVLPRLAEAELVLMPTLAVTTIPLRDVLGDRAQAREVAVLIGPEGDFAPEEVGQAERYGARPVSLGRLTLRTETAAVAALAMIRYALNRE